MNIHRVTKGTNLESWQTSKKLVSLEVLRLSTLDLLWIECDSKPMILWTST